LKLVKRGHNVSSTIKATQLLKNAGFKVSYQMMPNLPGSNFKRDVKMFEEIFKNPDFQPDLLKIYPLALVKNTPLYKWYLKGKYKPYSKKELIELLIEIKKRIPYYCRIQRIIRDIPSKDIVTGGAKISNLREVVQKEMPRRGLKCKCIRCREVRENYNPKEKLYFFRKDYLASGGREIFLSFESEKKDYNPPTTSSRSSKDERAPKLYALLRLRLLGTGGGQERDRRWIGMVREVHTYGQMVQIGKKSISAQHQGLGKKLMKIAERITKKEFGINKIAVISAVGTRDYYRKLGYRLKNTYMVKKLK